MALYRVTDFELTQVADAIREKGGTSEELEFPDGYVDAIQDISVGTDVSDTTATAGDVLNGKEFYAADGTKTQGTITNKSSSDVTVTDNVVTIPSGHYAAQVQKTVGTTQAAQTITPTTSDQTIASGKYLTGDQTIKGDSNLIAENIKKDVQIFGVTGTHEGGGVEENDVTFYDYDGTIVTSYSAADFAQLSEMPSNPSHDGLISQGWNWDLSHAKTHVAKYGELNIGQMYITESGSTEIDVSISEKYLSAALNICVDGVITIRWGDNSVYYDTVLGGSLTSPTVVSHTYANAGNYTILITAEDNNACALMGEYAYSAFRKSSYSSACDNRPYSNAISNVRIGHNTNIGNYAFNTCVNLQTITIPNENTSIGSHAFDACISLACTVLPTSMTSINGYAFAGCSFLAHVITSYSVSSFELGLFQSCSSLKDIIIPEGITQIPNNCFAYCDSLQRIVIPDGVTYIGTGTFSSCDKLSSVSLPDGVTCPGDYQNCISLSNIIIPSSVNTIISFANSTIIEYHFLPTTPPTLPTYGSAFSNLPDGCIIYVPASALQAYKTATNWSTYASYIQAEP